MTAMSRSISVSRPYYCLNKLSRYFAEWQCRARSCNELMTLSDSSLRDIGFSRCDAGFESSNPFWMA